MSTTSSYQPPIIKELGSVTVRKRANSRVKTVSGTNPFVFFGNVAPGIADGVALFPRLQASIWESCRQKVHEMHETAARAWFAFQKNLLAFQNPPKNWRDPRTFGSYGGWGWLNSLIPWFVDSMIHWFAGSLIHWIVESMVHWVSDSLVHWFADFVDFVDWLIDWFIDWLIDWFTDWLIDSLIDSLIGSMIHCRVIDSSIHWFTDSSSHWFTEPLNH
jgi:hypothetical protein